VCAKIWLTAGIGKVKLYRTGEETQSIFDIQVDFFKKLLIIYFL